MKKTVPVMLLGVLLLACSKDDETTASTNAELITKSPWKFQDAGADIDKNGTIDFSLSDDIPDCVKNNTLSLSANGSGTVDEGASKCDQASAQSTNISWSFASNETVLQLGGDGIAGINGNVKIVTLDQNNLVLSKDTSYLGLPAALVLKLTH